MRVKFKRLFSVCAFLAFVCSVAAYIAAARSPALALGIDRTAGQCIRSSQARIASLFNPSLFELLLLFSPLLLFLFIRGIFKAKNPTREFVFALSIMALLTSFYIFSLGIPSKAESFVGITFSDAEEPTTRKLCDTALLLSEMAASEFRGEQISKSGLKDGLQASYSALLGKKITLYKPKKVLLSRLFSYTGALALYSFPTGEVNFNPKLPDYMQPVIQAHEYAHYLGAPSELDADFAAFVACISSDVPYIRYSGLLFGLEYILKDIRAYSAEMYIKVYSFIPEEIKANLLEYRRFSSVYHRGAVFDFFGSANRRHLQIGDTYGSFSYSLATRYIVHYFNDR